MYSEKTKKSYYLNTSKKVEDVFAFKVILKFWKKESKNAQLSLLFSECETPDVFVDSLKRFFDIKASFCLEEIWVMQIMRDYDKSLDWVKEVNGRIKLTVPDSYKEFLMKKGMQLGHRDFEDPSYEEE